MREQFKKPLKTRQCKRVQRESSRNMNKKVLSCWGGQDAAGSSDFFFKGLMWYTPNKFHTRGVAQSTPESLSVSLWVLPVSRWVYSGSSGYAK